MNELLRVKMILAGCVAALALAGCGGGGGGSAGMADPVPVGTTPAPASPANPNGSTTPAAPDTSALTDKIALDGREWLNFRRGQAGLSALAHSVEIDRAARGHSAYQVIHGITHDQVEGREGFTGVDVGARLAAADYRFNKRASHAFGEVISATGNGSGQYMAEELITAVYHRFVIFEPVFKEIGTGAATTGTGYHYFTANFTANNGYGTGIADGQVAVWPFSGQTSVPRNFFSDTEQPDPVPDTPERKFNEVGYPISVHANIDLTIRVTSFTVRPRGGADLAVRLLSHANDTNTGRSSAGIVPLEPLAANTVYDVSFIGSTNVITDGVVISTTPVTRTWSFTTR
jgi:uncharacterized protein YkwD